MLRGNSGIALQPLEHDVQMAVAPALFFWPSKCTSPLVVAAGFSVLFQVAEGHRLLLASAYSSKWPKGTDYLKCLNEYTLHRELLRLRKQWTACSLCGQRGRVVLQGYFFMCRNRLNKVTTHRYYSK